MMTKLVDAYIAMRRALGFDLRIEGGLLLSFGRFAEERGESLITCDAAFEWAARSSTSCQRARRLSLVIALARHLHAEDQRHEIPPCGVFGRVTNPRRASHIFSREDVLRIVKDALRRATNNALLPHAYSTLFALLACTGLRISEALELRFKDVTVDGLVIRQTKFHKSRIVPLHPTAEQGLTRYIELRRKLAPFADDHLFISRKGRPMAYETAALIFRTCLRRLGIKPQPGVLPPSLHTLRHTFAVRVLESCPDRREQITRNAVALSTYLGHNSIYSTYWYMDATRTLMNDIAGACETSLEGVRR